MKKLNALILLGPKEIGAHMKIMITSGPRGGGNILHILRCIKDEGHVPLWITAGKEEIPSKWREFIEKCDIEHVHFPTVYIKTKIKQEIPILFRKLDVDAAMGSEFFAPSTLLFRTFSTRNFYSYTYENHIDGALKTYIGLFKQFLIPLANKMFKRILVPVESTKKCWERLGLRNIHVNPLGVNLDTFAYSKNDLSEKLKILYVGNIIPNKGLDYLIKAVSSLDFPYSLTLAGRGEIDHYRRLAKSLKCDANFLGQVEYDALPQLYSQHNVFVLPSITTPHWKEQFGFVLVEAMATGRIVVGSNSGAIPDVVGDSGFIVPERDAKPLAEVLSRIYRNEHVFKTMPKKARLRAKKEFDLRENLREAIRLFEHDLSG